MRIRKYKFIAINLNKKCIWELSTNQILPFILFLITEFFFSIVIKLFFNWPNFHWKLTNNPSLVHFQTIYCVHFDTFAICSIMLIKEAQKNSEKVIEKTGNFLIVNFYYTMDCSLNDFSSWLARIKIHCEWSLIKFIMLYITNLFSFKI